MNANKIRWDLEITDTFAGEPNYSWVVRAAVTLPAGASHLSVMRACKRALELGGVRGRVTDYGDTIEFRPYGACLVAFFVCRA